jgi:hypothetical protein
MRPTGKRAVLEVLDAGSEWQRAGDRCRVGDVVLRLLKVDGTPGRRVLKLHADRLPFGWRSKEEMPRA